MPLVAAHAERAGERVDADGRLSLGAHRSAEHGTGVGRYDRVAVAAVVSRRHGGCGGRGGEPWEVACKELVALDGSSSR